MFSWFCPSTFSFARHFELLFPREARDVAARDSGDKRVRLVHSTKADIVDGAILQLICARICMCNGVVLICYITADESPKGRKSTVATILYRFLSCWCLAKSTFFYVVYQPCSFACIPIFYSQPGNNTASKEDKWRKKKRKKNRLNAIPYLL